MKEYMLYMLMMIFLVSICRRSNDCQRRESYRIERHQINLTNDIYGVTDIVCLGTRIFMLTATDIYLLEEETNSLKQLGSNLDKIDEFVRLSDTMVFASNDELFSLDEIFEDSLSFEKYRYTSSTASFYPELTFSVDSFKVTSCCEGEWGGGVFFEDIGTGKKYSTAATCLINIDTLEDDIYLFNYLPHLLTSTSVFKVGDVKSFREVNELDRCNWYYDLFTQDYSNGHYIDSILVGNRKSNGFVFDTTGMPIIHGYVDGQNLRLIRVNKNQLVVLSVLEDNEVELSTVLVELSQDRRVSLSFNNYRNNVSISCNDSSSDYWASNNSDRLSHIVNINRQTKEIDVYEVN